MRDCSIQEIRNVAKNPRDYFRMDLRQIRRSVNLDAIAAIWHTHPGGNILPSEADLAAIRLCEWGYLIATATEVAAYETRDVAFWRAFVG